MYKAKTLMSGVHPFTEGISFSGFAVQLRDADTSPDDDLSRLQQEENKTPVLIFRD